MTVVACTVAMLMTAGHAGSDIVINEIRVDQPGADSDEYFELAGPPGASLDGLFYVVLGDLPATGSGTVEEITDLSDKVIGSDGVFLVGEDVQVLGIPVDMVANLSFENCDNVTHLLVSGMTGITGDDLDVDDDCVLDITPWDDVLDVVALILEHNPPMITECHYGPPIVGPDGWGGGDCKNFGFDYAPGHVYRCGDRWVIGSYDPLDDTPGQSNGCGPTPCFEDINGNGEVEVLDLVEVITSWGPCGSCAADLNDDGYVGVVDLVLLIAAWGPC